MAIDDIVSGTLLWRLWGRLGWNDILQRYRRSLLGPFWLTASMAIMVVALGVLYAELFKTPVDTLMPYLSVGFIVWTLISSFLTESGTLFTGSESYIKQIRLPYSVYVYRSCWSKLIIFAHNAVIYVGVLLYFEIWPGTTVLLGLPGLILLLLNGALMSLYIGLVSARFRDIPQLVVSLVQIAFFLTPIFWTPDLLKGRAFVLDFNPFYHLIEIVRGPLLGTIPSSQNYLAVALITLANIAIAGIFFVRFRGRISYWV
jgi:ABC-2 type transport system permease protein/lipopolysaccharide transport system permease protein